jgi:hypothetical protein
MSDLFDLFGPPESPSIKPFIPRLEERICPHRVWNKTITVWPNENFERHTWTCADCGQVRGRP